MWFWCREGSVVGKTMTLRLPLDQAAELEAVARADGVSIAEAVRQAIAAHIEARRKDKGFTRRLRQLIDQDREILKRLSG